MSWASRAASNILPLSIEQDKLAIALREWRYAGNCFDLNEPVEICELCDHPNIRYQFEIANLRSGERLLIGSECINRFGIPATDEEGRALNQDQTRRKVQKHKNRLIEESRKRSVINSLVDLSSKDDEFSIYNFIEYLQGRGAFTANQMCLLIWRMEKNAIPHNPAHFKVILRRDREKAQIWQMPDWKLNKILPYLSTSQREWLRRAETRRANVLNSH